MECLPNALVQLIIGDGAPECRFAVGDRLQVCGDTESTQSVGSEEWHRR
jgi:hypothetical protein